MTQMGDLLNDFEEFSPDKMLAGERVPELLFGDVYSEQGDYNPNMVVNNNYSLINGNVPSNVEKVAEGESKFITEVKR